MRVYIDGTGCSRRKLETSKLQNYFVLNGFDLVKNPKKADYILVTTCAFKNNEEAYSMSLLRRLGQNGARILVYGCLPDIAPEKYHQSFHYDYLSPKNIDEIDAIFGNMRYRFADIKDSNIIANNVASTPWPTAINKFFDEFERSPLFAGRVANYLRNRFRKSGDNYYLFTGKGCLGNCSYCAIRHAVGRIRSKPLHKLIGEYQEGVNGGHRRFVLLGDDVGAYGQDIGSSFPDLLEALLAAAEDARMDGTARRSHQNDGHFHVEEIHPIWIVRYKDRLMPLLASTRVKSILCPIQSGNDRILDLMNRGHRADEIRDILSRIRNANSEVNLTSQIIVGFPTESEEEFEDTLRFLQFVRFDEVTVFPYDERENTDAVAIHPKVSAEVIERRVRQAVKCLRRQGIRVTLSCTT